MKKKFFWTLLSVLFVCCTSTIDDKNGTGNVYGVVTISTTAEPVRAAGVSLFVVNGYSLNAGGSQIPNLSLLLKTVTYDDGHFEFNDISPDNYFLRVEMDGYEVVEMYLIVEAGRTARADMQMKEIDTGVSVLTFAPTVSLNKVSFRGQFRYQYTVDWPTEYGFVYGDNPNPTINHDHVVKGTLTTEYGYYFVAEPSDLYSMHTYHVRAYAKNKKGISYGEDRKFNT